MLTSQARIATLFVLFISQRLVLGELNESIFALQEQRIRF